MLHYDYTVSGSFYKNQDDIGFGLIIKLSYSRYGQHVKTPDYFINPSGVLQSAPSKLGGVWSQDITAVFADRSPAVPAG